MTDAFGEVFMKYFLVICLLFLANCANQTTAQLSNNSSNLNSNIAPRETPNPSATIDVKPEIEEFGYCKDYKQIEIPKTISPFGKVNFKNLTYPKIWEKGSVKLKNGCIGEENKTSLGGCEFTLNGVDFVDFNQDGKDEALVEIGNFCGAGSSSYTRNYFIYGFVNKKMTLLWKLSEGPRAYCGLKEYELKGNEIILEVFSKCSVKNDGNFNDEGKHTYDYSAFEYTQFVFGWSGNKFGVKSREVFPFPENDIKEYFNNKYKKQDENNK
jgi:hypothetical protein